MATDKLSGKTKNIEELLEGFRELLKYYSPSCLAADASDNDAVMSSSIKPIFSTKISGPALTINIDPTQCFSPIDIIKYIKPGQVVVIDAKGETELSIIGGVISSVLKQKGAVGAVVDGAVRDVDEIKDIGFPLFAKSAVPRSQIYLCKESKKPQPIEVNVPVHCGGVSVHPDDIIVADETGVTVIANKEATSVLEKAKEIAKKEGELTKKIKGKINIEEIIEMTRNMISSQL